MTHVTVAASPPSGFDKAPVIIPALNQERFLVLRHLTDGCCQEHRPQRDLRNRTPLATASTGAIVHTEPK